jgi:hypothetical protein
VHRLLGAAGDGDDTESARIACDLHVMAGDEPFAHTLLERLKRVEESVAAAMKPEAGGGALAEAIFGRAEPAISTAPMDHEEQEAAGKG